MNAFECPFSYHGRKNPKLIALASQQKTWTYKDCNQLIEILCSTLKHEGVKPGDRVAFYPTLSFPTPLIFFALFRLEAIACPLNTYFPLKQLSQSLDSLTATYFLFPSEIKSQLPPIKQIALPFSALLKKKEKGSNNPYFLNKESHATYLFTSGTSSTPKIACHSLANHYYNALGSNAYLPLALGDCWLLSLPLYHVAGIALLFRSFLAGATVALTDENPHDAATLLNSQTTHVSFIPTQLQRLLNIASDNEIMKLGQQLKSILLGGASISSTLYRSSRERGLPVYPSYGMTEMSSQICTQFGSNFSSFSLGHPLPYRELTIDQNSEIHVRGKTLFLGYLKDQKSFHLPLDANGYFPTGDLGTYSPKKGLLLQGRKDRLFISGGENIYPEEIENHLRQIEGMIDVRVEPKQDQEFGMRPVAYIHSNKPFHKMELQEYLATFLPNFKIPVDFHQLEDSKKQSFKSQL